MREDYAVVSASELDALRMALARAFDALEALERGRIEEPIGIPSIGNDSGTVAEVF